MMALDAADSLFTVVPLHPHMACISQPKVLVISKGYYLVSHNGTVKQLKANTGSMPDA